MKPIYKPAGKAAEYCEYAINIYTECNHGCTYCFARHMSARFGRPWTGDVKPREGIVDAVKRQLDTMHIPSYYLDQDGEVVHTRKEFKGKLIQLCFTCDPYPAEIDTTPTREIIKAIKDSGNFVQILTKGGMRAERDFDLLGAEDWVGVTYAGAGRNIEPKAAHEAERLDLLISAKSEGIKTWVSFEPVYAVVCVYAAIIAFNFIDLYKIGKLNYGKSDIDWGAFGRECERLCKLHGRNYYIKEDLRKEMEAKNATD